MIGYYSAEQAEKFGTVIRQGPNGTEVECTCICSSTNCSECKWTDKVCVGEVGEYLRQGKVGNVNRYYLDAPVSLV